MQLVLRTAEVSSNGAFFVELVLNPNITNSVNWENVGGTSLAQYADLTQVHPLLRTNLWVVKLSTDSMLTLVLLTMT